MAGPDRKTSSGAARRLITHLAQPGAFACILAEMPDRLSLFISRHGVTLGAGTLLLGPEKRLVAAGQARWDDDGVGRRRLVAAGGPIATKVVLGERLVEVDGKTRTVQVDEAESPLAWLRRRKDKAGRPFLDHAEFAAGERLRRDLTLAGMLPRVTVDWTAAARRSGRTGPSEPADQVIAARQRVRRALAAVGSDMAGLLVDVCGFLKGLAQIERERGWPPRSGKLVLKLALSRLAAFYGLSAEARGPDRPGRIRTWVAREGRPSIDRPTTDHI